MLDASIAVHHAIKDIVDSFTKSIDKVHDWEAPIYRVILLCSAKILVHVTQLFLSEASCRGISKSVEQIIDIAEFFEADYSVLFSINNSINLYPKKITRSPDSILQSVI